MVEAMRQVGDKDLIALGLEKAGALAAAEGDSTRAGRLIGAADALRETIDAPRPRFDEAWLGRHLAAVAGDGLDDARAEGRLMSADLAIDEAGA
jgi:hypothetical protein